MVQAEQSVIGCLMMAPELLDRARAVLSPAMFEAQPLARIFSCMLELKKAGTPVDAVTVVSRLGDGYEAVIRECACIAPRIGTFPQYAYPHTLERYVECANFCGITGEDDLKTLDRFIDRIEALKEAVGIKKSIADYGVTEEDFMATLDRMVEDAFDDQCTGANPRYPLMSEIREMYLKAYRGEKA